jgi:hypothetical protein
MLHHDAITGTHSLTAKRDYDGKIEQAEGIIKNLNKFILNDYDQLFRDTYGKT